MKKVVVLCPFFGIGPGLLSSETPRFSLRTALTRWRSSFMKTTPSSVSEYHSSKIGRLSALKLDSIANPPRLQLRRGLHVSSCGASHESPAATIAESSMFQPATLPLKYPAGL